MMKFLFGIIFIAVFAALGWRVLPRSLSERASGLFSILHIGENNGDKNGLAPDEALPENGVGRRVAITRELKRDIEELKKRFLKNSGDGGDASSTIFVLPAEIQDIAKIPTGTLIAAAGELLQELEKEGNGAEFAKNTAGKILSAILPSGLLCPKVPD